MLEGKIKVKQANGESDLASRQAFAGAGQAFQCEKTVTKKSEINQKLHDKMLFVDDKQSK